MGDGGLDQGGSNRRGQESLESGAILNVKTKGFPNGLDEGIKKRSSSLFHGFRLE